MPLMLIVAVSLGCGPSIPGNPYRRRIKLCSPGGNSAGAVSFAWPIDIRRFRVYIPCQGIVHME